MNVLFPSGREGGGKDNISFNIEWWDTPQSNKTLIRQEVEAEEERQRKDLKMDQRERDGGLANRLTVRVFI